MQSALKVKACLATVPKEVFGKESCRKNDKASLCSSLCGRSD